MQPNFSKLKLVEEQPNFSTLKPVDNISDSTSTQSIMGTLLNPAVEGIKGLGKLYGGGEQGIANKLAQNVQTGAKDIQAGNLVKGVLKSGGRVAGDVVGTIYAPIGAVIGATGIGKIFNDIQTNVEQGKGVVGSLVDHVTNIPAVQQFALKHPNAGEDFGRLLNILFAKTETGKINSSTAIARTSAQLSSIPKALNNLRPTSAQITQERQIKITSGLNEQNTRLKSVDKSYNNNTITRQTDVIGADGLPKTETITPVDTFAKYNISPVIEKGSIQMGDYKNGTGSLGKIKEHVSLLDNEIDTKLVNSGQTVPVETLKSEALTRAKNNPEFKQAGTVGSNMAKIESRFDDYKQSYGDDIDVAEINNIRKVANKDWNPETSDVSSIVGDVARDIVYNVTPDKVIQSLLRQQGELLSARKYAQSINGTKVTGGRLGTMALRTTGAIIGSTIPQLPVIGSVVGMMVGEFASRALQQSQFKSLWTEARALIQRSNNTVPSQSAKIIPNKANIPKTIPQTVNKANSLTIEAQKYKSAEEFVKAQGVPIYHHGSTNIKNRGGTYFTNNESGAGGARSGAKGRVEAIIDESQFKFANKKQSIEAGQFRSKEEMVKNLKKQGFDGNKQTVDGDTHYFIFDESKIKIKSQLTSIWNKAQLKSKVINK